MAFAVRSDAAAVSEMNITPLVDVLLVLLVIFMLATPVVGHPLLLSLPQDGPKPPEPPAVVELALDAEGRWLWQGRALPAATAAGLLQLEAARSPQPVLQLSADPGVAYADWVDMLAASREAGFAQVALAAD